MAIPALRLEDVTRVMVKASGGGLLPVTVKALDRHYRMAGQLNCGFHFLIHRDGIVEEVLPLTKRGFHCPGHNHETIAICVAGRSPNTTEQTASLVTLLGSLPVGPVAVVYEPPVS